MGGSNVDLIILPPRLVDVSFNIIESQSGHVLRDIDNVFLRALNQSVQLRQACRSPGRSGRSTSAVNALAGIPVHALAFPAATKVDIVQKRLPERVQ